MLVEDLLHKRNDENPEDSTESYCKDCASGRKPYLVIFDIKDFVEVEMLLVRFSIFVMATMVMVPMIIKVVLLFIVAMVGMIVGFVCIHLLEEMGLLEQRFYEQLFCAYICNICTKYE